MCLQGKAEKDSVIYLILWKITYTILFKNVDDKCLTCFSFLVSCWYGKLRCETQHNLSRICQHTNSSVNRQRREYGTILYIQGWDKKYDAVLWRDGVSRIQRGFCPLLLKNEYKKIALTAKLKCKRNVSSDNSLSNVLSCIKGTNSRCLRLFQEYHLHSEISLFAFPLPSKCKSNSQVKDDGLGFKSTRSSSLNLFNETCCEIQGMRFVLNFH